MCAERICDNIAILVCFCLVTICFTMGSYLYKDFYPAVQDTALVPIATTRMLDFALLEELPKSQLAFVFEIARHGAQAPQSSDLSYSADFSLEPGMLTAQGLRQRRLLGEYNMRRYSKQYGLTSVHPSDFEIVSTNVRRTIQSAYAEASGIMNQTYYRLEMCDNHIFHGF